MDRPAYYTGDWAERHGGLVFFRARMDNQIKVRGYRIELDEMSSAIRACGWPGVCVFKLETGLAALVERGSDYSFDENSLRALLTQQLDSYAVPERIVAVPLLPRNDNDKLDYAKCESLLRQLIA